MTLSNKIELWEVPRIWPGETVVVIAGGPSMSVIDMRIIEELSKSGEIKVIAVNDGYFIAPYADVLYGCDAKWWSDHKGVPDFKGIKVGLRGAINGIGCLGSWTEDLWPDVKGLAASGISGLSEDSSYLRTGGNSGYQAINLAMLLGAERVVLLGYDMRNSVVIVPEEIQAKIHAALDGVETPMKLAIMASLDAVVLDHWFGPHPDQITNHPFDKWLSAFDSMVSAARYYGLEIINCTPGSALSVFPKKDLKEVFSARD